MISALVTVIAESGIANLKTELNAARCIVSKSVQLNGVHIMKVTRTVTFMKH